MIIYPSIDILDKKCVRLRKGDYDQVTVYPLDPVEYGLKWQKAGAKYLHVVDLNGARIGSSDNGEVIKSILENTRIPVQVGGGIRSMETVSRLLNSGVSRVILGTSAVKDQKFLKEALDTYKERIVVGIDAKDGYVAIDGWEVKSSFKAAEFALKVQDMGAKTIIYTDISRDGMLTGPNLYALELMASQVSMDVIASGGVGTSKDVLDISKTGVKGVIIGKALYEGLINLKEIIDAY